MKIPLGITQAVGKHSLALQQNSPRLLFVGGVAGVVTSTVLACRGTLKMQDTLDEIERDIFTAKNADYASEGEDEKERKKDLTIIYARSAGKMVMLYAPAVIVGSVSIAALTKSHNMLLERNAALTAAYTAVDKAFERYRQKVVENYGEEVDRNMRYETEEIRIEDEKGKKKTVTRAAPGSDSQYARFFDPLCPPWGPDPEINLYFLRTQQTWANDRLQARGFVFLNEVYKDLGIPQTEAGQVVGWALGAGGDNYIDFGIYDESNHKARDFVNGREGSILLDFNVDGVILDRIEEIEKEKRS